MHSRPTEAASAAVESVESEVGPHCTDMTTDSQRKARAAGAGPPDAWLGPVLVAGGVVTPALLEQLAADVPKIWSSVGLDALEAIERGGLVILDLEMPRLDGLGVLEELRAQIRTASLPVIVLTAQHGESEEKALDLGAQDYLTKPVQTRSLIARVRAVLKRINT